jgi:ergothioneine biosynthesis protein EgtB
MTLLDIPGHCTTHPPADLVAAYRAVRSASERLCDPLVTEDYVVQSMPDVSPTKWHLAHTTWFFETFVLTPHAPGYVPFDPAFKFLFNSYYVTVGDRHCRQNRGQLSRPTVSEVYAYRRHVDGAMARLLADASPAMAETLRPLMDIGLNHEQQHQELMLTDLKHVFWVNPLRPAYRPAATSPVVEMAPLRWIKFGGGVRQIGWNGDDGFAFDNESPRHKVYLDPFELGSRLVTNGEYKQFMANGGYGRADCWLSTGLATAKAEDWRAPLYWIEQDGQWFNHTLSGLRPVVDAEPVCHLSYFEADAFARWAGARLPTEAEWEVASETVPMTGPFVEGGNGHPAPAGGGDGLQQMFGEVWQWTASAYLGYPGFRPPPGALGEYNGKFMCNQFVLRGGSVATPASHMRRTYRNFFPPDARWQFTGLRLARP